MKPMQRVIARAEGEKATRGEDTLHRSYPTLMLRGDDKDYELSGAWTGYVLDEGFDEFGPYLTVRLRRSRFSGGAVRAIDRYDHSTSTERN